MVRVREPALEHSAPIPGRVLEVTVQADTHRGNGAGQHFDQLSAPTGSLHEDVEISDPVLVGRNSEHDRLALRGSARVGPWLPDARRRERLRRRE
jgi:hypothetical protein